eukprot:4403284-Pleurochrysis_carterae.AAC.1
MTEHKAAWAIIHHFRRQPGKQGHVLLTCGEQRPYCTLPPVSRMRCQPRVSLPLLFPPRALPLRRALLNPHHPLRCRVPQPFSFSPDP